MGADAFPVATGGDGEPPFLTEDELDQLYRVDPLEAMRVSRRQVAMLRALEQRRAGAEGAPEPTREALEAMLDEARAVLRRDGGDIELVGLVEGALHVRMTGNCAGCPRSALDLRNVVERLARARFPAITRVVNTRSSRN